MDSKLSTPTSPQYQRLLSHNSKRRLQYQLSEAITPFVSSTFIDFEDEREYLVKKIFPQLNLLCVEKGSRFEPLDLRWGISESQKDKGHLIQSCLDYVRHCSPYFICLLGERYGSHRDPKSDLLPRSLEDLGDEPDWLDKNLVVAAVTGNYSFILNNTDNHFASITELEITYRLTLQNPHKMFYYLRTPKDFSHLEESERKEKEKKFGGESDYAMKRLKNLKRKIRSYVPMSQIREYTTVEELGKLVYEDWSELIANEFFDVSTSLRGVAMEMYQEWQAHAAYQQTLGDESRYYMTLNSMLGFEIDKVIDDLYFKVSQGFPPEDDLKQYKECLSLLNKSTLANYKKDNGAILAVRGPRGSGKSAFLAYLSKKRSDQPRTPLCAGVKVFVHFVGCNSQSEDLANFMTRYIDEMTEYFLETLPGRDDNRCLVDSFHASMCFGPSVIFLDGMDQFASSPLFSIKEVKDCEWLPELLPPGCLLILSTTPHDHSHRALSASRPNDVTFFDLVTPETLDQKNQILSCHFGPRKKLEDRQKKQIIKCELSSSPVFLAALARELQLCGGYMSVDRQVEQYVNCSNLRTLWHLVILRWANDYGWSPVTQSSSKKTPEGKEEKWANKNNWVIDTLRLLCVSRNGLSQEDLIQCLQALGYRGDTHSVGTFDFMQFKACSQQAVLCRRNGLLYIKHTLVKETVFYFFLNGVCPEMTTVAVNSLSSTPQRSAARWVSSRLKFQNVIADYLLAQPVSLWSQKPHLLEELLWQLRNTGNLSKLVTVLTNPDIFTVIMTSIDKVGAHLMADVRNYWSHALSPTYDPGRVFLEMVHNLELKFLGGSAGTQELEGGNVKVSNEQPVRHGSTPCTGEMSQTPSVQPDSARTPSMQESGRPEKPRTLDVGSGIAEPSVQITVESEPLDTSDMDKTMTTIDKCHPSSYEKLSSILSYIGRFLQELQRNAEAETVYKMALKHQSSSTEYSAEEHSQLKYIECVLAIGVACARQNEPIKLKEACDWLKQALETVQLLLMVCIGEAMASTLQYYQGTITVELIGICVKQGDIDTAKTLLDSLEGEGGGEVVVKETESTFLKKCFYKAVIFHKRFMFEESGAEFEKVLRMYTDRYGPNHENLADVLIAFANLLADKNNFDGFNYFAAEDYFTRALKLKQKHQGDNHLEVAEVKELLARHQLTNQKLNSSQLDAYQHLLDAIDIRKLVLGPQQYHTAELQTYINENCKEIRRQALKSRSGSQQPDNFLDEDVTIPPVATPLSGSKKQPLTSRVGGVGGGAKGANVKLRPASALSWNDRDLMFLQQRKRKSARNMIKKERDNLDRKTSAPSETERGINSFCRDLPDIEQRSPTAPNTPKSNNRSRSQQPFSELYMRRHRSTCEIPGKFDISQSNARSVHGPNSTLGSLITDRPHLVANVDRKNSRKNRNSGSRNSTKRELLVSVPATDKDYTWTDDYGYGDGLFEYQLTNGEMFVPARFNTT